MFVKCLALIGGAAFWAVAFLFSQSVSSQSARTAVPYPEGYRRWVHLKSEIIGPESPAHKRFGGIHHIYANPQAMKGFETGRFPEGSVFVFDLLEIRSKDGATTEGARRIINVMRKDSKRFAETGGWGYEEFRGDSKTDGNLDEKGKTACFACHAGRKDQDYIFSSFRK